MFLFSRERKNTSIIGILCVTLPEKNSDLFSASLIPECIDKIIYLEFLSKIIYNNLNSVVSGNLNCVQC